MPIQEIFDEEIARSNSVLARQAKEWNRFIDQLRAEGFLDDRDDSPKFVADIVARCRDLHLRHLYELAVAVERYVDSRISALAVRGVA